MKAEDYIKQYLGEKQLMQLATVGGDQPWICTVHYVDDDQQNLYWLSLPSRRHSEEIAKNNKIAIAIAVKGDHPVVGIQAEGRASEVDDHEVIKTIMKKYVEKFSIGGQFYDNVVSGVNKHRLYKFTPKAYVIFDEEHSKDDPRQEWKIGA